MNMRPRCRPWLPLTTQQMRLRNLIRIQGVNIECSDEKALIYYTLHQTKEDVAFYTSEALPRRHLQQKWAEITCPTMLKSNANCVCVKVWACLYDDNDDSATCGLPQTQQQQQGEEQQETECVMSQASICALSQQLTRTRLTPSSLPRPPDKLLFTWGVYFSGLILLSQLTDAKCCANCLIFQINGDHFASAEHFTTENLREQLSRSYQRYSASVPKDSTVQQPDAFAINSPQVSRSSSPVCADWQPDLLRMSRSRYAQLNCPRAEVRKSYDLQKLLHIQELQRLQLQKMRESVEIATDIQQLSVRCITKEQLKRKRRTTSSSLQQQHHQYHSMGRTLSVLLAEQQQVEPRTLLRAQQLQQQLESLRCKQRLLQSESSTYAARNSKLRQRLVMLAQEHSVRESWLHAERSQLQEQQQLLEERSQQQLALQQNKQQVVQHVERRMSALCMELREIYPIGRNQLGFHTVCELPFPHIDSYSYDAKPPYAAGLEHVSPLALSASLGYVAHLVQMMSVILNRPLRNPIIHEGSRSRIVDIIKEIPYASREFPLYSRSIILSKPVKYAIYLLNQNIAQLCYDITGIRCDPRATIENLLHIFATLTELERHQNGSALRLSAHTHPNNRLKLHGSSRGHAHNNTNNATTMLAHSSAEFLSKSHSSVDMNHVPVPLLLSPAAMGGTATTVKITALFQQLPRTQPLAIAERNATPTRICRSVGSYSDCEEDDFKDNNINNDHCYSNSDSNLTFGQSGRQHV